MTLYFIIGSALAVWAVVIAGLGIKFDRFPGGRGGERVLIALSLALVAATIGSAIVLSAIEEAEHGEEPGEVEGGAGG
jgi:hypothetical protein